MIKKRKLVFDKTTYTILLESLNGDVFNFRQTFRIFIDKEFSGYKLVSQDKGLSGPTTYTLYKDDKVVSEIGTGDAYLPLGIVLETIKQVDNDLNK